MVRVLPVVILVAVALLAGGCAGTVPTTASPAPTPTTTPSGVLLTIRAHGGLCVNGPCDSRVFVERDGSVHEAGEPPRELGFVDQEAMATLEQVIAATDFDL